MAENLELGLACVTRPSSVLRLGTSGRQSWLGKGRSEPWTHSSLLVSAPPTRPWQHVKNTPIWQICKTLSCVYLSTLKDQLCNVVVKNVAHCVTIKWSFREATLEIYQCLFVARIYACAAATQTFLSRVRSTCICERRDLRFPVSRKSVYWRSVNVSLICIKETAVEETLAVPRGWVGL